LTSMKPGASALIVAVAHDQFRNLPLQQLRDFCHGPKPVLADLKSLYDRNAATALGFTVFRL
jgi:UDP-N-acetyl-D-galactosamine dehydrogenase